jgi:hypothetical protein
MRKLYKAQLRTDPKFSELSTTYDEEINNPNRGISPVLAEPISAETAAQEQEEHRQSSRAPLVVKYRGKYYRMTPRGRRIADLYLKNILAKKILCGLDCNLEALPPLCRTVCDNFFAAQISR